MNGHDGYSTIMLILVTIVILPMFCVKCVSFCLKLIFWNLIGFIEENCQKRELTTIDEKIGIFVFFSIKWKMSSIFIFCHFTGKIER